MVFGDKFDKVLWLIVVTDSKNRDVIADCINTIPVSACEQFLCLLNENTKSNDTIALSGLSGICEGAISYNFQIKDSVFSLKLIKSVPNEYLFKEVYELILYNIDSLDDSFSSKKCIGKFSCVKYLFNNRGGIDLKKIEDDFVLGRNIFGLNVRKENQSILSFKTISLGNIPSDINMTDFSCRNNIKKLIRRRKKN